jgi:phosphopantothenoylcysteine decarboxylase/phosphopantothenate--cysteine ligase
MDMAVNRLDWITVVGTGSVAAANLPGLCYLLRKRGQHPIAVVLTEQARRFVTEHAVRYVGEADALVLDHEPRFHHAWPNHVWLNRCSRITVVYPAAADAVGKIASGLGPDFATTVMLGAFTRSVIIVPSMSPEMRRNPFVQRNLESIASAGARVLETGDGMAPPVVEVAEAIFAELAGHPMREP